MSIRVTRVYASVSGTPASALRVTRVSASVAGTPAAAAARLHRISLQFLTTVPPDVTSKSAASGLVFGQTAVNSLQSVSAASGLVFSQAVSNPPTNVAAISTLQFGSTVVSSFKTPTPSNNLVFGQNVARRVVDKAAVSSLVFSHTPQKIHIKAAATSHAGVSGLVFSQSAKITTEVDVLPSALVFGQSAAADAVKELTSSLVFGNTVAELGVIPRTATSGLRFSHQFMSVAGVISTCTYNPQMGGGSISPGMDRYGPFLQAKQVIELLFPFTTPTTGLQLRSPEFGDRRQYSADRIFRETSGGELVVFRDDEWATQDNISVQIRGVKETLARQYLAFVDASLGKPIRYVDHEGRAWKALIVSTSDPLVRNSRDVADIAFELFILERI